MIKNRIERFSPYAPVAVLQFPAFLPLERRKTGKSTVPPMKAAVKLQFPVFLLSERRNTRKSTLPPIRTAVKLQFPAFLLGAEENWKIDFTANESSGKAAISSFPPL
ncbi:hypothetical protein AAC387_Pa06g2869 [Persea americana]